MSSGSFQQRFDWADAATADPVVVAEEPQSLRQVLSPLMVTLNIRMLVNGRGNVPTRSLQTLIAGCVGTEEITHRLEALCIGENAHLFPREKVDQTITWVREHASRFTSN